LKHESAHSPRPHWSLRCAAHNSAAEPRSPRRIRRGLIEATWGRAAPGRHRRISAANSPRPHWSPPGRISASALWADLRGEFAAASLKHLLHLEGDPGDCASPRRIRRGLIEARWAGTRPGCAAQSPRRIRRGLIEADADTWSMFYLCAISAANSPRPHWSWGKTPRKRLLRMNLRGEFAAASLKLGFAWRCDQVTPPISAANSPRPHWSLRCAAHNSAAEPRSPRRIRRGLIEALPPLSALFSAAGSPRRIRRGLIEASCAIAVSTWSPDLRGEFAAASLKQPHFRLAELRREHLRGEFAAASLKRGARVVRARVQRRSPRRIRRGLIEATYGLWSNPAESRSPRRIRRGLIEASRGAGGCAAWS